MTHIVAPGRRAVALYRSPAYSPNQHRSNDTLILDVTVARLAARGWGVARADEGDIAAGRVPESDWYLNMCQGPAASRALQQAVGPGAVLVNAPASVLNCHRHRMAPALRAAGVSFPETAVISTADDPAGAAWCVAGGDPQSLLWVKRGDVHAQTSDDVLRVTVEEVGTAVLAFRARGIERVALQRHVPGPVLKFYAVNRGRFFRWFASDAGAALTAPPDERRLQQVVFAAADALGLEVFGGDVVLSAPDAPVLVDINDWPSFAPCRHDAAEAIASYVDAQVGKGTSHDRH